MSDELKKMQITSYDTAGRSGMLLFEQMIQRDEYSAFSSHRNTVEFGLFEDGLSSQLCRT